MAVNLGPQLIVYLLGLSRSPARAQNPQRRLRFSVRTSTTAQSRVWIHYKHFIVAPSAGYLSSKAVSPNSNSTESLMNSFSNVV